MAEAQFPPRVVGVTFNPRIDSARELAYRLRETIEARGIEVWVEDDEVPHDSLFGASDLIICLGGDGSVLRCARLSITRGPLLLGVNFGRLGFLTELDDDEVL